MRDSRAAAAPFLMALSGASALAYELVWMRQLSRAFGVTVHAVAGLVALYMAGLALGSAWGARARRPADWLRVYAWLELAAGLCALAGSWWLGRIGIFAAGYSSDGPLPAWLRLALAAPALLPPTFLLGATLPALARDSERPALLYGANTLGAMGGLALAGFLTIGGIGERATITWAAALNALAAAAAFWLSRAPRPKAADFPGAAPAPGAVLALFALSGFCSLGCEVLWSRQFAPLLGNSTYAFALILLVYLGGIGLGSCVRAPRNRPMESLAALLAGLGCAVALSAASARFIGLSLDSPAFLYSPLQVFADFPLIAGEAVALVLPTALILGMLFPVGVELCGGGASAAGKLYAWSTVGAIAGSLFCGFWGISRLGAHAGLLALSALASAGGLGAAALARRRGAWTAPAALAGFSLLLAAFAGKDPSLEILLNRLTRRGGPEARVGFHDESPAATITGTDQDGRRTLFVNGIATSGASGEGTLMSALAQVFAGDPREALVICFGGGNAFRASSLLGARVDGVELVAGVLRHASFFHPDAAEHLFKPGNRIFIEDGRNFLLRSARLYDAIIIDGNPPLYSAGTVNLYTREFLALARSRLRPDGVLVLWLPTLSFESDYWQILSGLGESFEHIAVWRQPLLSGFLALGSGRPLEWPEGTLARRLRERAPAFRGGMLNEGYLRSGFVADERALRAYASRFAPLSDDRPTVEFPLPRLWRGEPLMEDTEFLMKALARPGPPLKPKGSSPP